jgi:hypothetical protein
MLKLAAHFEDLEPLRVKIYEQLLQGKDKKNNKPNKPKVAVKLDDVFLKSLRLADSNKTHLLVHFGGGAIKGASLARFLDREGFACTETAQDAMVKCEADVDNQKGLREFISGAGEALEAGTAPNDEMFKQARLAAALSQVEYQKFKVQKKENQISELKKSTEVDEALKAAAAAEIAKLQARVAELEQETTKVGEKRASTETNWQAESEIIKMLMGQIAQLNEARDKLDEERRKLSEKLDEADSRVREATHGSRSDLTAERRRNDALQKKWDATVSRLRKATRRIRQFVSAPDEDLTSAQTQARELLNEIGRLSFAADWDKDSLV